MTTLTLNNGTGPILTPDDVRALPEDAAEPMLAEVLALMDDDEREAVHVAEAPCTHARFLGALLERGGGNLIIG